MKKPLVSKLKFQAAAILLCGAASLAAPLSATAGDDAALNFVGADIDSVIKAVGHYTNITFVIDPRVKGSLTLVSEKSITKSQAFALLTSALRLQGYAVVTGDGYAKVVPEADAKLQPTPTLVAGTPPLKGEQIATQVFHLNYESASNLQNVLRPLISPNNAINANPGNNSLVITDYADNLTRLSKIIAALDAPGHVDVEVIPVRYAIATDLVSMVNKLLEAGGSSADGGRISVLADPRTNAVLLRAPSSARAALAKALIDRLDQPTAQLGNVHVVYLKNADATKLAQTLRAVVSSDTSTPAAAAPQGNGGGAAGAGFNGAFGGANNGGGNGVMGQSAGLGGALLNAPNAQQSGGAAGFIQADASTNTLIITASDAVYRNLRAVIDQLDVRRAQVYIESLIVEVTSTKASEFGIQWAGLSGNADSGYRVGGAQSFNAGSANNLIALATGKGSVLPGDGLSIGIFKQINGALGLGALVHALESDDNANILSTPNMITLDNELATIRVGQNVPILTGQFTSSSGNNANPFQTIDRKDVGLTLKVRPQISEGGTIKMAIYHETSSVDRTTLNSAAGITLNTRVIENNVIADDGQIIVLGGLIEDSTGDSAQKVNGLGDLPLVGGLFKSQSRGRTKTNLMIFLRPVVVRSKEQSTSLASDRYDYMRGAQMQTEVKGGGVLLKDLGTPLLPPLQEGRPVGGNIATPPPQMPAPAAKAKPAPAAPAELSAPK